MKHAQEKQAVVNICVPLRDDEKEEPAEEVNLPGESSIQDEFFTAIRDQRPLAQAAGADVRHSVALVCAAQESGRTGQVVTVG